MREMDSVVGRVVGEYGCEWETYKGCLFAGSNGIYFLGSFFLFERKIVMYWEEIRQVQKVDQGIEVICKDESVKYFAGIQGHERVWATLVSLHNDALLDRRGKRGTPRASFKRRNSDPWNVSCVIAEDLFNEQDAKKNDVPGSAAASANAHPNQSRVRTSQAWNSQEIEAVAGHLRLQPVPCSHLNTRGHLYVGEESLYFSGRRFFWEQKSLIVQWARVRQIQVIPPTSTKAGDEKQSDGLRLIESDGESSDFLLVDDVYSVWASHNGERWKSSPSSSANEFRPFHPGIPTRFRG
jgi:hypothetical protein